MTPASVSPYVSDAAPTGMLRFALVSIAAAGIVGGVIGGSLLNYDSSSDVSWATVGNVLSQSLDWIFLTVPASMIVSVVPIVTALAMGAGFAVRVRYRWARFVIIAGGVAVVSLAGVAVAGIRPGEGVPTAALVVIPTMIALSLATSAVAPWKGGFANPTRVAHPIGRD